jgi:glycosyltransferase involved in cell wall biosynthesis
MHRPVFIKKSGIVKIIHVIPNFFPETVGGTEVYCWTLCKQLQRRGIITEVLMPGYGQDQTTEYEYDGIRVVRYAEPTHQSRLHISGLRLPEGIIHFKEYLRTANPDCVHIHGIYPGVGITVQHVAEAKDLGLRVIYTMHVSAHICATQTLIHQGKEPCDGLIRPARCASCNLMHSGNSRMVSKILAGISTVFQAGGMDPGRWNSHLGTALSCVNRITDIKTNLDRLADLCDKVIVLANWFKEMMVKNGFPEEKMEFMPPAIAYADEPETLPAPVHFNYAGSVKLLFVGRIDPIKDVQLLLRAFHDLPENRFELSIYGQSTDTGYHLECMELANNNNIHWRGIFSRENLMSIFRQHDILCLPSALSEMSPLVIQEAFGARIPVLASAVLGNKELITHDVNGLLFPFKSIEGLRNQLNRLINESKLLNMLKNGVVLPMPFEEVARRYIRIYGNREKDENDTHIREYEVPELAVDR